MLRFSWLVSEEQKRIYNKALELKESGLGYKRIIKCIAKEDNVKLSNGTLYYWFNNDVNLLGGENTFKAEPSKEFSYVLGAMFGDGCILFDKQKQDYRIQLDAKDLDFVEKFSKCVSRNLGKDFPLPICKKSRGGIYSTQARSKQMYYFIKSLKEDFEKAKPFIEEYPAEFIQGLADSEGTASVSPDPIFRLNIAVANSTNYELLNYVKDLLFGKFRIESNLKKTKTAGMQDSIIDGRLITRTKDVYTLNIPRYSDMKRFYELIGFGMIRKMQRAEDFFFLIEKYEKFKSALLWGKLYHKEGRFWRRNNTKSIHEVNLDDCFSRPRRESDPSHRLDRAVS